MSAIRIRARNGMTLIELLIVIAIISLLVQIVLPAVEMSREAARRTQCGNNLHQIGIAVQSHESSLKHYPAGGWGYLSVGDPDRGTGKAQPGGWIYNVLPFIEQNDLHDIGKGLKGDAKAMATKEMLSHPLAVFVCPSRRLPRALPFDHEVRKYCNYDPPDLVGKSDYAGNGGDLYTADPAGNGGAPSYEEADNKENDNAKFWRDTSGMTGIFYQRSMTRVATVIDGLSKTYLAGEKYLDPTRYTKRIVTSGDDQCMYVGADFDILRWAGFHDGRDLIPVQDKADFEHDDSFGSPHPGGCQFLFCDGSVRLITYDIDGRTHRQQANRHDQEVAR